MPDPGFTFANVFQDYSFNHLQSAKGHNTARLMMVDGAFVWIIGERFHNIVRQADEPLRLAELPLEQTPTPTTSETIEQKWSSPGVEWVN